MKSRRQSEKDEKPELKVTDQGTFYIDNVRAFVKSDPVRQTIEDLERRLQEASSDRKSAAG